MINLGSFVMTSFLVLSVKGSFTQKSNGLMFRLFLRKAYTWGIPFLYQCNDFVLMAYSCAAVIIPSMVSFKSLFPNHFHIISSLNSVFLKNMLCRFFAFQIVFSAFKCIFLSFSNIKSSFIHALTIFPCI